MRSKPEQQPIRVFGQRRVPASFFHRSSNRDVVKDGDSKRTSCVSLSDFLSRRLNETPALFSPTKIQERARPFTSFLGLRDAANGDSGNDAEKEELTSSVPNKIVLEQFKQTSGDKVEDKHSCIATEEQNAGEDDSQGSRKRKNPFEGVEVKDRTRKPVIIIGDRPKGQTRNQRRKIEVCGSAKKDGPAYNHYANGSGWWDCDMEGIDGEEVGFSEVWEGVGSTTFGGIIDWH